MILYHKRMGYPKQVLGKNEKKKAIFNSLLNTADNL